MGIRNAIADIRTIKVLLTTAEQEAQRAGDDLPGPEHLLLSALALPDGSAARAFTRAGGDPHALRGAIAESHATALRAAGLAVDADEPDGADTPPPKPGAFRSTPQAQRVFQRAVALSKSQRPARLTGAHVVAAACELERGTAVRALRALGVDRDELRKAARDEAGLPT